MKNLISFLLMLSAGYSYAWQIQGKEYQFEKLNDQVYVIHGPQADPSKDNEGFMNNPGLILSKNGAIVVDPGASSSIGRKVFKEIRKIIDKPILAIINTHNHGDHWLGNEGIQENYPKINIYSHHKMLKQARDEGQNWIEIMEVMTNYATKGTKTVPPTDGLTHLTEINIDGEIFRAHIPNDLGHSDSDLMIEHVGSKTIFMGDNLFNNRLARAPADIHKNMASLKYAIDLGMNHYIPGHGPSGSANTAVKPYLDYFQIIMNEAKKAYDDGKADFEIKPDVNKKLTSYHSWSGYEDSYGKHLNKLMMEIEARDF